MFKKLLAAMIIAVLTTIGVVIPINYVDSIVSFVVPSASASEISMAYLESDLKHSRGYSSCCSCECGSSVCTPKLMLTTVEALRPSSSHFSGDRSVIADSIKPS